MKDHRAAKLPPDVTIGGKYVFIHRQRHGCPGQKHHRHFDLDNTSTSKRTREFLNRAEREGEVIPCDDLPKSFILTAEYGFSRVHLTALNAATLEKRLK